MAIGIWKLFYITYSFCTLEEASSASEVWHSQFEASLMVPFLWPVIDQGMACDAILDNDRMGEVCSKTSGKSFLVLKKRSRRYVCIWCCRTAVEML